jgi:hypothetical protein
MTVQKRKPHTSDSFIIYITPPDKYDRYPGIFIHKRKKVRASRSIGLEEPRIEINAPWEKMTKRAVAKLAQEIGEAILANSPNAKK